MQRRTKVESTPNRYRPRPILTKCTLDRLVNATFVQKSRTLVFHGGTVDQ